LKTKPWSKNQENNTASQALLVYSRPLRRRQRKRPPKEEESMILQLEDYQDEGMKLCEERGRVWQIARHWTKLHLMD
jgi:hypothetical protein